jgi:hypothetical protein
MKIDYPRKWFLESAIIEGDSEIGVGFEPFDENNPKHSDPLICPPYQEWDDWDGLISQWELDEY